MHSHHERIARMPNSLAGTQVKSMKNTRDQNFNTVTRNDEQLLNAIALAMLIVSKVDSPPESTINLTHKQHGDFELIVRKKKK